MQPMTIPEIISAVDGTWLNPRKGAAPVTAVCTDSRKIATGCLFLPWVGERFDGHDFIDRALDAGAAAQSLDRAIGLDLAGPDPAGDYGWHGSLADDLVRLGRTLEGDPDAAPVRDATTMHQHADRKTLRRERAKKIALGHKPDDHEDEIDMTMKGY